MRSSLVMLAGLAGSALAYPAELSNERRTFGLVAEILGSVGAEIDTILTGVLGLGQSHSSGSLLVGLSAHGAAALEGGLLGCGAGVIHADARAQLKAWLHSQTTITGSLKTHLLSWCEGSVSTLEESVIAALSVYIPTCAELAAKESIYVTVEGIFEAANLESTLVLSASAQASLSTFISAHAELDVDIKAGLNLCAAGGIIGSLHADLKASLLAWVTGSDCGLDAGLKASVLAWIKSEAATDLVAIGSLTTDALTSLSVGASIEALVEESGVLSAGAMASISAFLEADLSADIDVNVRAALKACAEGKLATALSVELRTALAIWLSGSSCSLGVELKAVILLWLSVAVTAEASVDIVTGLLVDITGFLTEEVLSLLSVNLRGALGLLISGESLTCLSWEARAELAAFLGGCTGIDISVSIEIIIIEWFTGCSIPGGPSGGGTGSSSVPSLPTPTGVTSGPAPSGPAPTSSVPAGPSPSGPAGPSPSGPAGPSPSGPGSIPGGPAPTTVPGGPAPSGTSGPSPSGSGPIPSGPAPTTVPAGPSPSGPGSIPGGPAPTTVPGGPSPSGPAPTGGPSPSGPSPSGSECTTETLEWTTAWTETLSNAWSTGYTETISTAWTETYSTAWSTGYTETIPAPAPTSAPAASGSAPCATETVTVTQTVCGCE